MDHEMTSVGRVNSAQEKYSACSLVGITSDWYGNDRYSLYGKDPTSKLNHNSSSSLYRWLFGFR